MNAGLLAALALVTPAQGRTWEDEIVYGIILEKFADGDPTNNLMRDRFGPDRSRYEGGFWGGDLQGVLDHLGDLQSLGVTALLLYPVMRNDDQPIDKFLPTGYRPKDYETVDPNFGDIATLRRLVDEAHRRGLKVILDLPLTLPGFEHPYLADPGKKGWFGEVTQYGVPRWKVENLEVADYLIGIARRWKERSGCDGFRLDSAHLQPIAFWKRFVTELKAAPPVKDFVLLPELTIPPREAGPFLAKAGFDGAYDFGVLRAREVLGQGEDISQLSFIEAEAHQFYPAPRAMMAPIDNYELAFVSAAREPKADRTKLALTYILTLDRVPLLYAGNELGLAFQQVGGAFPPDREQSAFLAAVKSLIALRLREPAFRRGHLREVRCANSLYAYLRELGDDRFLVILNAADRPASFRAPIADRPWADCQLADALGDGPGKPKGEPGPVTIEPFGSRIWRLR
jgi:alpha-amylase